MTQPVGREKGNSLERRSRPAKEVLRNKGQWCKIF